MRWMLVGSPYIISSAHSQVIEGGRHCLEVGRRRVVDVQGNFPRKVVCRLSESEADK